MKKYFAVIRLLVLCALFYTACGGELGQTASYSRGEPSKTVVSPSPEKEYQREPRETDCADDDDEVQSRTGGEEQEELPEYATDLRLTAGCLVDPPEMAVANWHEGEFVCESILATPMMNQDGDFFEVASKFVWSISDDSAFQFQCLNGPNDNLCWPLPTHDIFDDPDGLEPSALVTACAMNDCPDSQPEDCQDTICAGVMVRVAINVEGQWIFMGSTLDPETHAFLSQTGREFVDDLVGIKDGLVEGTNVSFEYGDYLYTGTISQYGETMTGVVTDLITSTYIGAWWAIR